MMHMMRWTRPDIHNSVRDCSMHMHQSTEEHYQATIKIMDYVVATPERELFLAPKGDWNGKDFDFEFKISGKSDSDYAKCKDTSKSITGCVTYLNGAPVMYRSSRQKTVSLSVTEAEMNAAVTLIQDILFACEIVKSLGLKVKLPMKAAIDNSGTVFLANGWSIGGRTRHVEVKTNFLREMKETGMFEFQWISTQDKKADVFTKNVGGPEYNRFCEKLCGSDEYYK